MDRIDNVQVVTLGAVTVGTLHWRVVGAVSLTICAKATFDLVPGEDMQVVGPTPLRRDEEHELPAMSVRAPADLLPQLRRAEVTLSGRAKLQEPAPRCTVRLALTRGEQTLLDKRLEVIGDRKPGQEPSAFDTMPLGYERALGGIGVSDNPIGRGAGMSQDSLPNVIDPQAPDRCAGFGPIPSAFAQRKAKLAGRSAKSLGGELIDIPDGFDWEYFQVAPKDQQLAALHGDEWIWLEHLDRELPRIGSRLPSAFAEARIFGYASALIPDRIPLRPESLHILADERRCQLVWRGGFLLPTEVPTELIVAAGLSVAGEPIAWPRTAAELTSLVTDQTEWLTDDLLLEDVAGTITIVPKTNPAQTQPRRAGDSESPALPFVSGSGGASEAKSGSAAPGQVPGAPWSAEPAASVAAPQDGMGTVAISPETPRPGPTTATASTEALAAKEREAEQRRAAEENEAREKAASELESKL